MANQIQDMNSAQANAPEVERAVIGADAPEIMMPNATLAPLPSIVTSKSVGKPGIKHTANSSSKPKPTPVSNPFEDNSIPFRPAEDYPPGVERPIEQPKQPDDDAPLPNEKPEKPSPIPVPEKPSESAAAKQ